MHRRIHRRVILRAKSLVEPRGVARDHVSPSRRAWSTIVLLLLLIAVTGHARGDETEGRLLDGDPYDVIVLNEQNQGRVLKVLPLDLPRRNVASHLPTTGSLRVRLVSNPSEEIDVSWNGIAKVEFFSQLVLAEARQMMSAGKFDAAFENLTFVYNRDRDLPGLDETIDQLLYTEASSLYQQGNLERALLLLDEVYQRAPTRRGLVAAIERVLDRTFDNAMRQRDFPLAHRLYLQARNKYAESVPDTLKRWQQQLEAVGSEELEKLRTELNAGQLRAAYMTGRRLMEVWPATPGAAELVNRVTQQYPLLRVGVQQTVPATSSNSPLVGWDWAVRRVERLRMRHLFDSVGVGPDGNEYRSNLGTARVAESNRSLAIQIGSHLAHHITSVHLAQLLLAITDPEHAWFNQAWTALVERIGAHDLALVEAGFRRPHLRPAALLDIPLDALGDEKLSRSFQPYLPSDGSPAAAELANLQATVRVSAPSPPDRPGASDVGLADAASREQRYVLNPQYFAATATQPREVVEHRFETPRRALRALQRGEIDLLDRVFPADVPMLRRDEQWVVTAYRIPTLHVLVPNRLRPHTSNRLFRRGLVYAIDREKILRRDVLGGTNLAGCGVISGPFSPGISADDPVAYGNDARIKPRAYDPRHAKTLLQLAQLELISATEKDGAPLPDLEHLILAHPDHEIARVACAEIVEDLKIIGLPCTRRVLPPGFGRPADDDWDLLYIDYRISEPLVDAERLLGFDGLVGSTSPHLNLALRQLSRVDNWNRAGERLRVIHQLCFDDTTVVPLWQIVEHLAYRQGIQGIAAQPMTTYQDIENWRLSSVNQP